MLLALSVLLVLVTSFFCSLSEASLLSVSPLRLHTLADKSPTAAIVLRMKESLNRPVAAILILNTIANTGGAAIAGREYSQMFGSASMALFTAGFTIAVLVLAELVPKTLGVTHAERAVLLVGRPLRFLVWILTPATWLTEVIGRATGGRRKKASSAVTSLEDLRAMARLAVSMKALGREEQMIIDAASRLPRVAVRNIMIHREDIVYLSLAAPEQENLLRAQRSMHSRLPLCHTDLDDMVGMVNVKEVLWRLVHDPEDREEDGVNRIFGEALRQPLFVDETIDVSQLLQTFSKAHEHMAVVRSKGRVVGIVTLEDIIEELVGEIDDEFDRSPTQQEALADNSWRFGGGKLWSDVAKILALPNKIPETDFDLDGRFDLNDLAADRLRGRLRTGGTFTIGHWRFKVARMRRGKVLFVDVVSVDAAASLPSVERPAPKPA